MNGEQENYYCIVLSLSAGTSMTFETARESLEKKGFFNCESLAWQLAKFGKCQWGLPRLAHLAEMNAAMLTDKLRGADIVVGLEKLTMP